MNETKAADVSAIAGALDRLRTTTRRWIWIDSTAAILAVVTAFFWGSLVVDNLLEPPTWVRGLAIAAVAAGVAWIVVSKLARRLRTPLRDGDLALIVERHHPEFADSLTTAVELGLAPAAEGREPIDRVMLDRTVAHAVELLPRIRPHLLFKGRHLTAMLLAGLLGVASIAAVWRQAPGVAGLWARRMLLLENRPWPRQTSLVAVDFENGIRTVARGSDVDVIARANGRIPEVVELRVRASEGGRTERMGGRGGLSDDGQLFGHVLDGVRQDLRLSIRGGDARIDGLVLRVLDPPTVDRVEINYTLPPYLGGGVRQASAAGIVQVPKGSSVEIACVSTKPLSRWSITSRPLPAASESGPSDRIDEPQTIAAGRSTEGAGGGDARRIAARIDQLDDDRFIAVNLTDTDGLTNVKPIAFRLASAPDQPPQVALRMLGISTAVTAKARVPLVGEITDDHGLGSAWAKITRTDKTGQPPLETEVPIARAVNGATQVDLPDSAPESIALEPLALVPGTALTISVSAADTCGLSDRPNVASGDVWTLQVVTPEVLAAMLEARELVLRRRFENVLEEMSTARETVARATDGPTGATRLAEAASRAAGETGEIATGFLMIRREFDNNRMLTPELDTRLFAQIASPLEEIAIADLPGLQASCRRAAASAGPRDGLVQQVDAIILRMRAVLDRMMELENFNEVVELLRSAIRTQEEIRSETLRKQKERARALLEQP